MPPSKSPNHQHHNPEPHADLPALNRSASSNWRLVQRHVLTKTSLKRLVAYMIASGRSTTTTIIIGKEQFKVHLIAFQAYTNFFASFKSLPIIVLPESKVTPLAFRIIYRWMINDIKTLPCEHLMEVYRAALFLEIDDLLKICWSYFDYPPMFTENQAVNLHMKARTCGIRTLTPLLFNRISKFFLSFVATKEFCELCIDEIFLLLSLSTVGVNTEVEILMAIVVWLTYDMEKRSVFVNRLMKCVRLQLLPLIYLYYLCFNKPANLIANILCTTQVQKWAFKCLKRLANPFVNFYKRIQPKQRRWIFDKCCKYHHQHVCTFPFILDYKHFVGYLKNLKEKDSNHWQSIVYKEKMSYEHPLLNKIESNNNLHVVNVIKSEANDSNTGLTPSNRQPYVESLTEVAPNSEHEEVTKQIR